MHTADGHAPGILQARMVQVMAYHFIMPLHCVLYLIVCRGRLEVLAALTPKKFWRGDWRPGPRNVRFRYHVSHVV